MGHRLLRWLAQPVALWLGLGVCFFGSLLLAARFFPHTYDWRSTVISSLASPRDNPQAYGIACVGLALSGLLLLPFAAFLQKRLGLLAPGLTTWAGRFFLLGAIALTLSALVVPGHYRILGLGRTHEHLAQISGFGFCLAFVLYFGALLRLPPTLGWFRVWTGLVVLLPVTALIFSRLTFFLVAELGSPSIYRAVKASIWNSLAFWEWVGACCIYLFLGLMTLAWPEKGTQDNAKK